MQTFEDVDLDERLDPSKTLEVTLDRKKQILRFEYPRFRTMFLVFVKYPGVTIPYTNLFKEAGLTIAMSRLSEYVAGINKAIRHLNLEVINEKGLGYRLVEGVDNAPIKSNTLRTFTTNDGTEIQVECNQRLFELLEYIHSSESANSKDIQGAFGLATEFKAQQFIQELVKKLRHTGWNVKGNKGKDGIRRYSLVNEVNGMAAPEDESQYEEHQNLTSTSITLNLDGEDVHIDLRRSDLKKLFNKLQDNFGETIPTSELIRLVGVVSGRIPDLVRYINTAINPYGLQIINEYSKGYLLVRGTDLSPIYNRRSRPLSLFSGVEIQVFCSEKSHRVLQFIAGNESGVSAREIVDNTYLKSLPSIEKFIARVDAGIDEAGYRIVSVNDNGTRRFKFVEIETHES